MLLHQRTTVTFKPRNSAGLLSHLISRSIKKKMHASIAVIYPLQQLT